MWRPYLAIVKDSFRAALATRVLYVMLGLITLLLLVLAPLQLREVLDWEISLGRDVRDAPALAERLVSRRDRAVIGRIWERLPATMRQELESEVGAGEPPEPRSRRRRAPQPDERFQPLVDALNELLGQRDFYDAEIWQGQFIEDEARGLIERGLDQLNEDQVRRLNRLLLSRALRPELLPAGLTTIHTMYGPWRIDFLTATTTQQQLARELSSWVAYIFDKFVLSIGLVIAILVTSNWIPEMFEAGSLNLLLSKPITRWALVVSKFVGGCSFVALLATYLFCGLWLWLGLRMGIWDRSILMSIPLYVVVFAIYYSVSVLVGIIWRSAVLSVIMTALFWALCFVVGLVHSLFHNRTYQERMVAVVPRGPDQLLLGYDALQRVWRWDVEGHRWLPLTRLSDRVEEEAGFGATLFFVQLPALPGIPLVFEPAQGVYLRAAPSFADPDSFTQLRLEILYGDQTAFVRSQRLPAGACAVLPTAQGPLVATDRGSFYRLDLPRLLTRQDDAAGDPRAAGADPSSGRLPNRELEAQSYLVSLGPDQAQSINGASSITCDPESQEVLIVSAGSIYRYHLGEEAFHLVEERELDSGGKNRVQRAWIASGGERILVALGNGKLIVLSRATLEPLATFLPESRSAPRQVAASPDGSTFAVNYRNGRTWLIDAAGTNPAARRWAPRGIGNQQGVGFDGTHHLWITHDLERVSWFEIATERQVRAVRPGGDILRRLHRWLVRPIYLVCPKPGEFYKLVQHLSSTSDTRYNPDVDLTEGPEYEDPWSPLLTGTLFMAVCLGLACGIFHRSDY